VLGLGACTGDDPGTPPNNTGGSSGQGGGGESGAGNTGGTGATGGASGAGATGGGGGMGDTGGTGVTGGAGGMGATGGSGGMGGGDGDGDGSSWTHLGYDQANNYHNPHDKTISAANAAMLEEKWVFPVQDGAVVHGGVIIAEGKVFATSSAGVYAINLVEGTQAWHRPELVSDASPAYADGAVYIHTQPAELYKLDAATGDTLFGPVKTYNLAGADGTSSPVVANGKVVVGHSAGTNEVGPTAATSFGGVEAFNTADLTPAWTYNTCEGDENGAMTWSTVSIDVAANVVYASTGNNYTIGGPNSDAIHAIDLGQGDGLWKKQVREGDVWSLFGAPGGEDTDFGSNPILAQIGDNKVVAAGDKASAFWVLDRDDGAILHTKADLTGSHTPNFGGVLNNGAYDGETFYVIANDATRSRTTRSCGACRASRTASSTRRSTTRSR
jgi:outer membrane protein assembly factor BamB